MAKFKVGDVVQLKSGSPTMTVVETFDGAEPQDPQLLELLYFDREPGQLPGGQTIVVLRGAHTINKLSADAVELVPQHVTLVS